MEKRHAAYATDDQRWEAVAQRDRRADGAFLYAVRTTGVYCRPGCGARRPNRANVAFFPTCAAAERAGFRACQRCRPKASEARPPAHEAVRRACALIEEADEPPSLNDLAAAVGLSPYYFHRQFKEVVGVTPKGYASAHRLRRLQAGLARGRTVTRAIYEAGFGSSSRCYEDAGGTLGMTPSAYQNGGCGRTICFAVAACYLGHVLVAATERGVCTIELGDDPEVLRQRLTSRFTRAHLVADDPNFAGWVTQVVRFLEAPADGLALPLDVQGTAFQRRVWEALRAVPAGATTSYAELACQIGSPSAVRAVAQACAANPVAVAIPCHRAVGKDGDLRGYRWGIERKRALLAREAPLCDGSAAESSER